MGKFDDIVKPERVELLRSGVTNVATRVQTSLYARLRATWGHSSGGRMAWLLIRSATPSHRDHEDALSALCRLSLPELRELRGVAAGTLRAAKENEAWGDLARAIVQRVDLAIEAKASAAAE